MNAHSKTVGECAEAELIETIRARVPDLPALVGNGDDAAVFQPTAPVVVSSDMLVEDRHFKRCWSTGADVGWRAAMQNFADIAAMGGEATTLIVALAMPQSTPLSWLEELAAGFAAACTHARLAWKRPVGIGGGDLTAANELVISVTALGELACPAAITRAGAQIGDVVALCGTTGHSAAGLALGGLPPSAAPAAVHSCWQTYLRPNPPLAASGALCEATAAMDVSDGLIRDATRLAHASNVTIDLDQLAPDETLRRVAHYLHTSDPRRAAKAWQLTGGEDHSLLATFPPGALPPQFTPIGTVRPLTDQPVLVAGQKPPRGGGFDHFRA